MMSNILCGKVKKVILVESCIRHIQEQLSRFNTFRHELPDFVSLSTRDVATDDIAQALLTAETRGKKQVTDFVVCRAREDSSKFHDTLPKNKSPTLAALYNVTVKGSSIDGSKEVKAGRCLFQRLIVSQDA